MTIRYRYEVDFYDGSLELKEYKVVRTTAKCEWVALKSAAHIYGDRIKCGDSVGDALKRVRAKRIMCSAERKFAYLTKEQAAYGFARRQRLRIHKAERGILLARTGLNKIAMLYPSHNYKDHYFTGIPEYV